MTESQQQSGPAAAYNTFIALNRDLLYCYASNGLNPNHYKQLAMGEQRDGARRALRVMPPEG